MVVLILVHGGFLLPHAAICWIYGFLPLVSCSISTEYTPFHSFLFLSLMPVFPFFLHWHSLIFFISFWRVCGHLFHCGHTLPQWRSGCILRLNNYYTWPIHVLYPALDSFRAGFSWFSRIVLLFKYWEAPLKRYSLFHFASFRSSISILLLYPSAEIPVEKSSLLLLLFHSIHGIDEMI